jgi:branched-chain amino acid aminotransferase
MILRPLSEIDIVKAPNSKIGSVDFDNLVFGNTFTDHMLACDFRNGEWEKPVIRPYEPFLIDPSAKVFHYGQAIFEGMKAYKDENGAVWLFRPEQNFGRFNKSAMRMAMPEVPESVFLGGLSRLLSMEKEWVRSGDGQSLYIRPFMIAVGTGVVAAPSTHYRFMIILSPARAYYSGTVRVIIAEHYSRAANGGIGAAKAAGNYSGQFYPQKLAQEQGFQQVIWTDDATHTKLEEAGTMNVFFRIGDTLLTAPVSERILDGVTRKSLIDLARQEGIAVEERSVLIDELIAGAENGSLKEMFGAGTAAVVSPIAGFQYKGRDYAVPEVENSFASRLKQRLTDIQYGRAEDTLGWMARVE